MVESLHLERRDMAKAVNVSDALRQRTIGFIGAGNMALALIQGLLARGLVAPAQVLVTSPSGPSATLRALGVRCFVDDNRAVAEGSDVLVLAVKPFKIADALQPLRFAAGGRPAFRADCVLVSIASGVTTRQLYRLLADAGYAEPAAGGASPLPRALRVMPNTPAQVLQGASAMCGSAHASAADRALVRELFEAVGTVQEVEEKHLDAVTGLSGSGPAYVMLFIEALADGAVCAGLPRPASMALALQLVKGAAAMAQQTGLHPGALKDAVASPGGTTIAGIHALEVGAFRGAVMSAVVAASRRAAELGAAEEAKSAAAGAGAGR